MSHFYTDYFSLERTPNNRMRMVIQVAQSQVVERTTLLDRAVPVYVVLLVLPVLITVWLLWTIAITWLNFLSPPPLPTYEEANKWFDEGNSYIDGLPEAEKQKWLAKENHLPLGL
jgi:hypothetical protein